MQTPEKIAAALRCCADGNIPCNKMCAYDNTALMPDCQRQMMADAAKLIEQLAAQVPKWVSVEDGLPERFENVLVFTPETMLLCHYDGDEWVVNYDGEYAGYDYNITHWMPLPEPPKEEM